MMKKITSFLVCVLITFGTQLSMASETYTLSLEKAIEMVMTDNSELKMCDINLQKTEKQLKDAALNQKDYKNVAIRVDQNFDLIYVKNGYYVKMFRKYSELCKKERIKTESAIKYNTINEYYTCKNALMLCEVYESAVKRAEDNLEIVNQQHNLGMCTALEVTNAQISLDETKAALKKAETSAELAIDSLKIRLGVSTDSTVILTDEIIAPSSFEHDYLVDTQNALKTRYDVKALETNAELAKDYYQTASLLNENSVTFFTAYADYIKAMQNYTDGVKNIVLSIKSAYYNVENSANSADIAKRKFDYKKSEYEVNKVRYEMGMITNSVLTALSDELTISELDYKNALLTYKLAAEKYGYEITTGI